jgi:multidrug efflux pump subunit AcrA (membrane-fusion protein)
MIAGRHVSAVALAAAALAAHGCTEVEEAAVEGYEPAKLADVEGSDVKRITLTREGAARTGLRTVAVRERGAHRVVPYSALLYDGEGGTFVYTADGPLTFVKAPVDVARIEGDRVLITGGPPAGSRTVTTGTAEVNGAEHEIAGSH